MHSGQKHVQLILKLHTETSKGFNLNTAAVCVLSSKAEQKYKFQKMAESKAQLLNKHTCDWQTFSKHFTSFYAAINV